MEKRHAFLVALLITTVVAGNWLFFNASGLFPDREIVIIARVIDGDTVELEDGRTIRLLNINTPEKNEFGSELAYNYLIKFTNKSLELEVAGVERYGRVLGRLFSDNYLNLEIVKLGFGTYFLVDDKEIGDFVKAQESASFNNLGIWKKSEYYGCLNVEIEKEEEYVIIEDGCDVDFDGWTIKDESTKKYKFKNLNFSRFVLYSESGKDNEDNIYWGRGKVWNNDRDSVFIRDDKGLLVYYDSYGY